MTHICKYNPIVPSPFLPLLVMLLLSVALFWMFLTMLFALGCALGVESQSHTVPIPYVQNPILSLKLASRFARNASGISPECNCKYLTMRDELILCFPSVTFPFLQWAMYCSIFYELLQVWLCSINNPLSLSVFSLFERFTSTLMQSHRIIILRSGRVFVAQMRRRWVRLRVYGALNEKVESVWMRREDKISLSISAVPRLRCWLECFRFSWELRWWTLIWSIVHCMCSAHSNQTLIRLFSLAEEKHRLNQNIDHHHNDHHWWCIVILA